MRNLIIVSALLYVMLTLLTSATATQKYQQLFTQTAAGTSLVGTTAVETTLTGAGLGSKSITKRRINKVGQTVFFSGNGIFTSDNDGAETLTLRLMLAGLSGSELFTTGALNVHVASVTNSPYWFRGTLTTRTAGATGKVYAEGQYGYTIGAGTPVCKSFGVLVDPIDITAGAALDIAGTWGTGDAGDTITSQTQQHGCINYN